MASGSSKSAQSTLLIFVDTLISSNLMIMYYLDRLKSQVEDLDGVGGAWLGPLKKGGVRGGSVTLQIEVESRVLLPALIQSVQALDDALLILPFKSNSWTWR